MAKFKVVIERLKPRLLTIAAGAAVLALAIWLRNPSVPYARDTTGASDFAQGDAAIDDDARRRARAIESLRARLATAERALANGAARALETPDSQREGFEFLRSTELGPESAIVLYEGDRPFAWSGSLHTETRQPPDGASVTSTPFFTALNFVVRKGTRRAVAVALIHAEPPASELALGLDASIDERDQVKSFSFASPDEEDEGELIRSAEGRPLLRVDATPVPRETVQFGRAVALQTRGSLVLGVVLMLFLAISWTDRRRLGTRLFALAVSLTAVAVVPWNNLSNFARAFDPAIYFLPGGGPFTASVGILAMSSVILTLATFAWIRARRQNLPRAIAAVLALVLCAVAYIVAQTIAAGIALPPNGATGLLWITWEIPLFLTLFSLLLTAWWLGSIARGRLPVVRLRAASVIAIVAGTLAVSLVWDTVTRQRIELATRDITGLQQSDGSAANLLQRFGAQLMTYDSAGGRADLLKRYAISDLAPAALQVSLATWTPMVMESARVEIAPLQYDSATVVASVRAAIQTQTLSVRQALGPTGRQIVLAAPHRSGDVTTVVVSPKTRLVASNPFASLLGLSQPAESDVPYSLTVDRPSVQAGSNTRGVAWRHTGNEWHGDQIIETSTGPIRAHAEVDLRSWPTRLMRASLIVLLNVTIVGFLWALGAMAEGGFFRWVRGRAWKWGQSYRGRLTLALFMFFVVPALSFAGWSYQRLRGDDREVRELLLRETLTAASSVTAPGTPAAAASLLANENGATPLFEYRDGLLAASNDPLYEMMAPAGRTLPGPVFTSIVLTGELSATWQQLVGGEKMLWGYRADVAGGEQSHVISAPARSDELVLDRRRRDLTMLVLFATAVGGLAALWLSGIAAKRLARDLELSRIEVARAERVLAWGEMARQVAHEIKNPLTPIRLGVQHLRRARFDPRVDFDKVLDENVTRILSEIDRLDEIARAFSRYGSAPADLPPPESVDVAAILRDAVGLERIGVGDVSWELEGADGIVAAQARSDELREVLLNVFENARLGRARNVTVSLVHGARTVCVNISDDGSGIARGTLPRVFEPHFSTRTTGSGLGLAISRRLLESWGGTIDITSEEGAGTRVAIILQAAAV